MAPLTCHLSIASHYDLVILRVVAVTMILTLSKLFLAALPSVSVTLSLAKFRGLILLSLGQNPVSQAEQTPEESLNELRE